MISLPFIVSLRKILPGVYMYIGWILMGHHLVNLCTSGLHFKKDLFGECFFILLTFSDAHLITTSNSFVHEKDLLYGNLLLQDQGFQKNLFLLILF